MLQLREKEIFETLKRINKFKFVIIGGYAVNAYTLPRFSIDCDIVVKNEKELKKIEKTLIDFGYAKEGNNKNNTSYYADFLRFEKNIGNNMRVSVDILIKEVLDRQTYATFSAVWVFDNSEIKTLIDFLILSKKVLFFSFSKTNIPSLTPNPREIKTAGSSKMP